MSTLLTVHEAADLLRLSDAAVYALCKAGQLPHYRLGKGKGAIRINEGDLLAYLQQSKQGATLASQGGPLPRLSPRPQRVKRPHLPWAASSTFAWTGCSAGSLPQM